MAETAVWPILFLTNMFTALKGSLFYFYLLKPINGFQLNLICSIGDCAPQQCVKNNKQLDIVATLTYFTALSNLVPNAEGEVMYQ